MGEFEFLRRARTWFDSSGSLVGPDDDAAVLPGSANASIVATTDVLIEGSHFRRDWSSPADIGFRAVAVNVSDLAAMGAEPRWILLGLGAPPDTDEEFLRGLYSGLEEGCRSYDASLVGGDTVRCDRLLLCVTALGVLDGAPLTRAGARPGDVLTVTGPLGLASTGANLLLSGNHRGLEPSDALACIQAHRRPEARVAEGRSLRVSGAHAAMDLSDGLGSDAYRLAEACGFGVEIDGDALPIAPEVRRVCAARGWDAQRLALSGGEDYELLAAVPDGFVAPGVTLHAVGRVVQEGVWLVLGGERRPMPEAGWDHFRTQPLP